MIEIRSKAFRVEPCHPLIELTLARMREFWREPEAVFWVFVFPVLLAWALGIAFRNAAPERVRVAIERGQASEEIAAALSDRAQIRAAILSPEEAAAALRTGKVDLVIRASRASDLAVYYRYDPTRPESKLARLIVADAIERARGRRDLVAWRDEQVTEPGARYIDFLVPGLVGLNLMGSGMWGLGFAIVQARVKKLLKRFAATPMKRSDYLLSFVLSRLIFLALEVVAVIGFARLAFGFSVRGAIFDLAVVSILGAMTFAGLGLLVAARTRTIEGVSGLMNLVMLPMWLLSGTFFSYERFPRFLHPAIRALPLTALNDSLRAIANQGATLLSCSAEIGVMLFWGGISFAIALRIFRWQ
jgi:ABC-type multidrug transport system permease subunit